MTKLKTKTITPTKEPMTATAINKPNPGSKAAIDAGCTCPVMDNEYGAGYMGMKDVYIYSAGCKLHKPDNLTNKEDEN
jgi:hypothetical protein